MLARCLHVQYGYIHRHTYRGDMIETFKFTHDYYDKKASGDLLKLTKNSNTKTNGYKLDKVSFKTTQYQNFFTNRVVNLWNSLPSHIVKCVPYM